MSFHSEHFIPVFLSYMRASQEMGPCKLHTCISGEEDKGPDIVQPIYDKDTIKYKPGSTIMQMVDTLTRKVGDA